MQSIYVDRSYYIYIYINILVAIFLFCLGVMSISMG